MSGLVTAALRDASCLYEPFLFDFDGVIADTENHHIAAWQRTLMALGWQVPDEVAARSAEVDDREFLRDLFAAQGIEDGDIEGWVRRKQAIAVARCSAMRLGSIPEWWSWWGNLPGRCGWRSSPGTWRENVEAVLAASRLAGSFELIVAKEDVAAAKPDPEAYLLALERLGIGPADGHRDRGFPLRPGRRPGRGNPADRRRPSPRIRPLGRPGLYFTGFEPVSGLLRHLGLCGTGP